MRQIYSSRTASVLFVIAAVLVAAGSVMIFTGPVEVGGLVGTVGVLGAIGSARLNHARKPH